MKKYRSIVFLRILIVALTIATAVALNSCGNDSQSSDRKNGYSADLKTHEDSLFHDVMAGHDAGMAKMGKLSGLIKTVKKQLDSIQQLPPAARAAASGCQSALSSVLTDLEHAQAGMNDWMEKFNLDSAKDNPDARVKYLESEKLTVNNVRDQMLSSIKTADSILSARK
jgi:hypothetical protein